MFNDSWKEKKANIMQFTQFLQEVFYKEFLPQSEGIIAEFIYINS
jgi:hypothetical protein